MSAVNSTLSRRSDVVAGFVRGATVFHAIVRDSHEFLCRRGSVRAGAPVSQCMPVRLDEPVWRLCSFCSRAISEASTTCTATGRSILFIRALLDEVCRAGGELVIHHSDPAWTGTPPFELIPAIEEAMEPCWWALCGPPDL